MKSIDKALAYYCANQAEIELHLAKEAAEYDRLATEAARQAG